MYVFDSYPAQRHVQLTSGASSWFVLERLFAQGRWLKHVIKSPPKLETGPAHFFIVAYCKYI